MCVNALGFQGSIRLPSGPKLREGQLDGYILTCTQAVKSAVCLCMCVCVVCVCMCLAGKPSTGTVQQSRGRRGGFEGIVWPSMP